jgi:hypothetical protein
VDEGDGIVVVALDPPRDAGDELLAPTQASVGKLIAVSFEEQRPTDRERVLERQDRRVVESGQPG